MARILDTATLDSAAKHYAAEFIQPDQLSPAPSSTTFTRGPRYVMQDFFNFTYEDEFTYLTEKFQSKLGSESLNSFAELSKDNFKSRSEKTFHKLLAERMSMDPDGEHIAGKIGTVQICNRKVGMHMVEVEAPDSIMRRNRLGLDKSHRETIQKMIPLYWPVYMGEGEERAADSGVADILPLSTEPLPLGALNTRISNEVAQLMANAGVDNLNEGSDGATIQGRSGAQPTDPDTAVSGTNLFTLTMSTTAFGAATDAAPGALKTANSITDDTSADATGTLGYCRASSSNASDTPLDDHFDGEAGTSGADFNFNTLAIVSGSTVSMTSYTITMPES